MTDPDARPEEPPKDQRLTAPAEPATSRALWPTFMRRTLSEDTLRRGAETAAHP